MTAWMEPGAPASSPCPGSEPPSPTREPTSPANAASDASPASPAVAPPPGALPFEPPDPPVPQPIGAATERARHTAAGASDRIGHRHGTRRATNLFNSL